MFEINAERFHADAGARLGTKLRDEQRSGIDFLLARLGADPGFTMLREIAYVLATIRWETASTFQPIRERRASRDRNPQHWERQNRYWGSGYYGRGYVQLTWDYNYRRAGKELAGQRYLIDGEHRTIQPDSFLKNPDWVMQPEISYEICARGMREGWFTGRKLGAYIREGQAPDYVNARRIVNGVDRASDIAAIANQFELLLRATAAPVLAAIPIPAGALDARLPVA
jgi:putative chitinase